jgi:hypothetical protein
MAERMKREVLYPLQEAVFVRLQSMGDPQFAEAKLCGGTALARCWLEHRISYDLDFFLPQGFKAADIAASLKKSGIAYDTKDIVDEPRKANQLHGFVLHEGQLLKVSFVEDAYFTVFPAVQKKFGNLVVRTEDIPGLYHRKLRTVAGSGAEGDSFEGGRQKARDLFDLHVLSVAFQPIREFMDSLPYAFPSDAFDNGLASMPWFDLMDELDEIACDPKWNGAKDVAYLQDALLAQIGATAVMDEIEHEAKQQEPPPAPEPVKTRRDRTPGRE